MHFELPSSKMSTNLLKPKCVKSFRSSDVIWRHITGSTMVQAMACSFLMAPKHYPNQCWLTIRKFLWHLSDGIFIRKTLATNRWHCLEDYLSYILFKCPRASVLTFNVRGQSFLGLTRSISWLLMPWLLTSPGHQQPWYWLCGIGRFLSYLRKDFIYLRRINVEK